MGPGSPTVLPLSFRGPAGDLLFLRFPPKSNPIVFVFKICTHLYNNLYLVVFGTIRGKTLDSDLLAVFISLFYFF